jgi:predicted Rossmann fold flavoprotein
MKNTSTIVIGGGAAGICAAISSARRGEPVIICEKMSQLGKKILASGNGRCNLLNDNFSEAYYNPSSRHLVKSVFDKFGQREILDFFQGLGLQVYSREGRIFPVTNQAASVLKVLELELKRLAVTVEFNFDCSAISHSRNGIQVFSRDGKTLECHKLVLTGGGKTYPAYGSDGNMFLLAQQLGHKIIQPVPAAVSLLVKDKLCQVLQGQRIVAKARSLIEDYDGEEVSGELLFTQYGLSGTCILDISEEISVALNRLHKTKVFISLDFVPFMDKKQLTNELNKRKQDHWAVEDRLAGILPNKFSLALKSLFENNDITATVDFLKDSRFQVSGTRGWNEAEFTSGGISINEINSGTLESNLKRGIYFAGEVLDVNGKRGGYNLGWAWASGYVAGLS